MVRNIHQAAIDLHAAIDAPEEALIISVFADSAGRHIRVFVRLEQERWVGQIPPTFAGFRVVVERRQTALPMSTPPNPIGSSVTQVPPT